MGGTMLVRAITIGAALFGFFGRDLSRSLAPYLFQVELLYSFVRLAAYLVFVLAYVLRPASSASSRSSSASCASPGPSASRSETSHVMGSTLKPTALVFGAWSR
jgi:hypothetical protein